MDGLEPQSSGCRVRISTSAERQASQRKRCLQRLQSQAQKSQEGSTSLKTQLNGSVVPSKFAWDELYKQVSGVDQMIPFRDAVALFVSLSTVPSALWWFQLDVTTMRCWTQKAAPLSRRWFWTGPNLALHDFVFRFSLPKPPNSVSFLCSLSELFHTGPAVQHMESRSQGLWLQDRLFDLAADFLVFSAGEAEEEPVQVAGYACKESNADSFYFQTVHLLICQTASPVRRQSNTYVDAFAFSSTSSPNTQTHEELYGPDTCYHFIYKRWKCKTFSWQQIKGCISIKKTYKECWRHTCCLFKSFPGAVTAGKYTVHKLGAALTDDFGN